MRKSRFTEEQMAKILREADKTPLAEDAFAPALILRGLAPDDPKAEQWLAALGPEVSAAIDNAHP